VTLAEMLSRTEVEKVNHTLVGAVYSLFFGCVGEWLKPRDCKSRLNRALVRIQPQPPNLSLLPSAEGVWLQVSRGN
jgi:hypothetical protein